jgi:hypothetical protein
VFKAALGRRTVQNAVRHRFILLSTRVAAGHLRGAKAAVSTLSLPAADEGLIFGGNFERLFPNRAA